MAEKYVLIADLNVQAYQERLNKWGGAIIRVFSKLQFSHKIPILYIPFWLVTWDLRVYLIPPLSIERALWYLCCTCFSCYVQNYRALYFGRNGASLNVYSSNWETQPYWSIFCWL